MVAPIPDSTLPAITAFCKKWKIVELSVFGSILRDDFGPASDVDVLVVFAPDAPWSYWDWPSMTDELGVIFGRKIDLVEKAGLKNPFRRHAILSSCRVLYAA